MWCPPPTVLPPPSLAPSLPQRPSASAAVREYALTALAKLEPKFGGQAQRIKGLIAAFAQARGRGRGVKELVGAGLRGGLGVYAHWG